MQFSRGRRRRSFYYKKRKRNLIPLLTFLVFFGLLLWAGKMLVSVLFSDVRTESTSSILHILEGRAEFSLAQNDQWTTAFSEQKFLTGDSLRTQANTRVSLEMLGGNIIFLGPNTEITFQELQQKSSGEKKLHLQLTKGRLWARVSDDEFGSDTDSEFRIETNRLDLFVQGTVFDIQSTDVQDVVRLIKGNIETEIKNGEETYDLSIGVGQKLVVNTENIERLKNKQEILEGIDAEFQESDWHLNNLERFFPQEAAQVRRRIEINTAREAADPNDNTPRLEESDSVEPATIISPTDGERIPASQDTVTIEGTAPEDALQVMVNDYTLTQFNPGDRKWTYFAAQKYGTLLPGENKISVIIVSKDGKRSKPTEITIFYEGEASTAVSPDTEITVPETTINDFAKPVITTPPIISPEDPYQTSADKVTVRGLVDPKTNAVEVAGYRLQKFKPGNTEFTYTAIANENMQEGENTYEIKAFGPDSKTASTIIKIFYSPVQVDSNPPGTEAPAPPPSDTGISENELREAEEELENLTPSERILDLDM